MTLGSSDKSERRSTESEVAVSYKFSNLEILNAVQYLLLNVSDVPKKLINGQCFDDERLYSQSSLMFAERYAP